jgi:hypothetical protein
MWREAILTSTDEKRNVESRRDSPEVRKAFGTKIPTRKLVRADGAKEAQEYTLAVTIEDLKSITYLKTENLTHGRTLNLMPLWDGENWQMWIDTPEGFMGGKMIDAVQADYVAMAPAKDSDLFIPFVHLMWQQASWPEVCPLINGISDDFHNMGTSMAKLRHFFDFQNNLPSGASLRFARTELEYLVMLCRSVYDLLQKIIAVIWKKIQLHDEVAERRRRSITLPDRFSRVVLYEERLRTAAEIENKFGFPLPLAEEYAKLGAFFSQLRDVRNRVVHGHRGIGHVFDTERGVCVNPKVAPFSLFNAWRPEHYYNENIVSVLPWLASIILETINACNRLTGVLAIVISMPPEIAPGYKIFVRGPHNDALVGLLAVYSGASPWWN